MNDFEKRLEKAIRRGQRTSDARAEAEAEKAVNQQELRHLHTQYRLELSDQIEGCLKNLVRQVPGFRFQAVVSERGWGAAVSRDDLDIEAASRRRAPTEGRSAGRRTNFYSRLELTIRPLSDYFVLELAGKGTIRNKEVFNRNHYERLADVDLASFTGMIDHWVLEYAELYAAKS